MGGYYTQVRDRPFYRKINRGGYEINDDISRIQRTTSFRTSPPDTKDGLVEQTAAEFISSAKQGSKESQLTQGSIDNGHEFSTEKQEYSCSHPYAFVYGSNPSIWYQGALLPSYNGLDKYVSPPRANVGFYGTKAIKDTIPTNPVAGLNQFAGEIDQIPRFGIETFAQIQSKAQFFRGIGSDWLNVKFGWVSFISDINKLMNAVLQSSKIIDQYYRDSARPVHRRRYYRLKPVTEIYDFPNVQYPLHYISTGDGYSSVYEGNDGSGTISVADTVFEQYWFSGSYTYLAFNSQDALNKIQEYENLANHIVGTRMTPDVLWELAPWSWLIDWFVNIGDVTANAVRLQEDSLVLRYGYLMHQSMFQRTMSLTGVKFKFFNPGAISQSWTQTLKERVRATPYGFALDPNSFSDQQWAILAALGMSKAPRSLIRP